MDVKTEQNIIRLWNELRRLQRDGQPTAAIQRKIEKALAERDQAA